MCNVQPEEARLEKQQKLVAQAQNVAKQDFEVTRIPISAIYCYQLRTQ